MLAAHNTKQDEQKQGQQRSSSTLDAEARATGEKGEATRWLKKSLHLQRLGVSKSNWCVHAVYCRGTTAATASKACGKKNNSHSSSSNNNSPHTVKQTQHTGVVQKKKKVLRKGRKKEAQCEHQKNKNKRWHRRSHHLLGFVQGNATGHNSKTTNGKGQRKRRRRRRRNTRCLPACCCCCCCCRRLAPSRRECSHHWAAFILSRASRTPEPYAGSQREKCSICFSTMSSGTPCMARAMLEKRRWRCSALKRRKRLPGCV